VVRVEDGMSEDGCGAVEGTGEDQTRSRSSERRGSEITGLVVVEDVKELFDVLFSGGLVEGDGDRLVIDLAEVDVVDTGVVDDLISSETLRTDGDGVEEEGVGVDGMAETSETLLEDDGEVVDASSDLLETLRTMIDSIHGGDVGEKSLGSTDVTGGLFTSDVLFSCLEGETISSLAVDGLGDTNDTTGTLCESFWLAMAKKAA
jgi:hypothetical protein